VEKLWREGLSERVRVGHAWLDDEGLFNEVVSRSFGTERRSAVC
jgi:hypothetical protein